MVLRSFEDVLSETGWGLYNQFSLFICVTCSICSTMAITTLPFALPVATYDLEFSEKEILWIYAALPIGTFFGGIFFGLFSDIISRKCVITSTLLLIFLSSFSYGFTYELTMYLFFSFLFGCCTLPNLICVKIYLSEILPMKSRGYYLALLEMFSIVGYLISSCINWLMRARENVDEFEYRNSWRLMFGLPASLSIFIVCFSGILQPTPRELLARNSFGPALIAVKYMFALNNSDHAENFKVSPSELRGHIEGRSLSIYHRNKCIEHILRISEHIYQIFFKLGSNHLKCLILASLIRCSLFSSYTMSNIWLTKSLYTNFSSDCLITSIELVHLPDKENNFEGYRTFIPIRLFFEYFINGIAMLTGVTILSFIVDKIGRRLPLMTALLGVGLISTNFIFTKSYSVRLTLTIIYMLAFAIANSTLDIIIIENLATSVRSTGLTVTHMPATILSVLSHLIINLDCKLCFYIVGAFTIVASGFSYFLPELKRLPMVE